MSKIILKQGDCLELIKDIPDKSIDCIITSPPYYNAKEYSHWTTYQNYLTFLQNIFTLLLNKLKENRMCIVNISCVLEARKSRNTKSKRYAIPFNLVNIMENIGYEFLEDIIWEKPEGSAKNRNGRFFIDRQPLQYKPNIINEYILVFQKPANYLLDKTLHSYSDEIKKQSLIADGYERTNIWKINPDTKNFHPAPFPIKIPYQLISYYTFVNDIVLDPFMGSGTTGVACKELNRNFIGFELDEKYFTIAKERIENA